MTAGIEKRIARLPLDVVMNHILPFTYQTQSRELLADIRSCVNDYNFLENWYDVEYNDQVLLYDLIEFCNQGTFSTGNFNLMYIEIVRRHIKYTTASITELQYFLLHNISTNVDDATEKKIRFLWGLLTSRERTDFINKYIIEQLMQ